MTQDTVLSYPIPAFSNPPIQPQFFQPSRFVISAIGLGATTLVTTSVDHNYVIGQLVRLLIPFKFGSRGLNGQQGMVISIPSANQVEVNIDSNGIDPFINASSSQQPQIIAIGDNNSGAINNSGRVNEGTFIPGSFQNISPL